MSTSLHVVIVGQGYVGLPLAVAAATVGHRVVGLDRSPEIIERLNVGESHIGDVASDELRRLVEMGTYRATLDPTVVAGADVVVICVPTPYHNDAPDLSFVEAAAADVASSLTSGTVVILESTTYPGTTEELLLPILERGSGLRAGTDFHLVFSPERIDPGNPKYGLHNTPKIVGGLGSEANEAAAAFYGSFVERVITVSGPRSAEMSKLLENTFRHINIALVNELAILCRALDVDVWEVIEAAASKPFGFMAFYPGPGVGGHCIPVDPMYLSWRVRQLGAAAKFIDLARDVNDAMPVYCAQLVQDLLNDRGRAVRGTRVLIIGVAYKPDVGDMRESPALPLMAALAKKGADLAYHDPLVATLELEGVGTLRSVPLDAAMLAEVGCAVIVTPHAAVDHDFVVAHAPLVFDTRNVTGGTAANVVLL